ncbi:MAG: flagellar biosynthetic protein FliR [Archangium sp.]|nr:flagellar biosynthetic protein FliR [Archangium sp.]
MLPLNLILGFVLVLTRISALMGTAPVLSSKSIPMRIKATLAFAISFLAFSAAGMPTIAVPDNFGTLAGLVLSELAVGLAAGLSSRLVLDAAQFGGQTASGAMGLGFGHMINPNSGAESTTVGELYGALALGVALTLGIHTEAIAWIVRSLKEVPPGGTVDVITLSSAMVRQVIFAVTLAIRVAYPLFAASLFGYAVLGLLGKASPQLSLSNLGFGVSIMCGGGALYLVAPEGARVCAQAALTIFSRS